MPEIEPTVSTELVPTGLEDDAPKDLENTEEQKKAVKRCSDWFTMYDKPARSGPEKQWNEDEKLRVNKHWDLLGPTGAPLRTEGQQAMHPNSIENVTMSLVEGQINEFAQPIEWIDFPEEESDDEVAAIMTDMKQHIAYKNQFEDEQLDWNGNYFWLGTGIWKVCWDPSLYGGVGPNRWLGEISVQSRSPWFVFPDARCGQKFKQARRCHDARVVTKEYILERFPQYGNLVADDELGGTSVMSSVDTETTLESQMGTALLVETWYIGAPLIKDKGEKRNDIGLHVIWWAGETNPVYLGHANYQYWKRGRVPKLPFIFRARYKRENSPFGYSEGYFIKQVQIMLNKTSDIIMEAHVHNTLGQTLYQNEALSQPQKQQIQRTGTLAGMWNEVQDITKVHRMYGSSVPGSVQNEMNRLRSAMENITGRYDVTMGRTPGSITAFKALALLDQRAQVRLRSADRAIRTALEELGMYINELIPQYYTEQRAYRIMGADTEGRPTVKKRGVFKLEDIQKAHFWADGKVVPLVTKDEQGNRTKTDLTQHGRLEDDVMIPPVEGDEDDGGDYELYVPALDVKCRTTSTMPSERMFFWEMAKELLVGQAIDLQQFYTVLETGRFPPWASIAKKVAEREAKMLEMQQAGAGGATGSGGLPQGGRWTYTAQVKDPNAVQALSQMLGGGQAPQGGINPVLQQFLDNLSPEDAQAIMEMAGNNPAMIQELVNMQPEELEALLHPQETQQSPREWRGGAAGGQGQGPVSA